jgi:DegV family protein with EDD domain
MTYKIIGDSCTDLTEEMLADPHFVKVPLSIQVGAETVADDETFQQGELLQKMRVWPDAPKTACPSPAQYLSQFSDDGDNYVVTLSAQVSGSYNAAVQAENIYREEGGRGNVHVFNSRSASSGQVLIALLIRELAQAGTSFQELVDRVEGYIDQMHTMFVLENLENLRKNGRLTKVQSLVTGALRVKLLMGATETGEIKKLGQGLSIRQTLARMVSHMEDQAGHVGRRLVIAHCNNPERAEYVRDLARQRCQFGEILIVPTGGVSTVYANEGGVIVAY